MVRRRALLLAGGSGALFGFGMPSGKVRELKGVGRVWVPSRLDSEYPHEPEEGCRRFEFRRYYPWYRFDAMGSSTPVREALYIGIGCGDWAGSAARSGLKDGVYRVNNLQDAVVVVDVMVREARIAYRVWRRDASGGDAQRIVDEVARSLVVVG